VGLDTEGGQLVVGEGAGMARVSRGRVGIGIMGQRASGPGSVGEALGSLFSDWECRAVSYWPKVKNCSNDRESPQHELDSSGYCIAPHYCPRAIAQSDPRRGLLKKDGTSCFLRI